MSSSPQPPMPNPPNHGVEVTTQQAKRKTRRAFIGFAGAGLFGAGAWAWLGSRSLENALPWPFRKAHEFNEQIGRALFDPNRLAPEFSPTMAREPRPNGPHGMPVATATDWKVAIEWANGKQSLSVAELFKDVPRVESTTEFKCIEGWSSIVTWGGIRLVDAAKKHGWPVSDFEYVSMMTPDGAYYVGLDRPSALHPQTLLCDTMNGEPLTALHGAPVRLIIPVKYGIKNIKWIGRIAFMNIRPDDYWAQRGYDWYSGL